MSHQIVFGFALLRKVRVPRYVPTSRSARIVVTPLHESPGPTTAGASLFWPPSFLTTRPGPSPTAREFCDPPLTSQKKRKMLPLPAAAKYMSARAENRPALPPAQKGVGGIATRPSVGDVASDVFGAGGQIAKASSDPARNDFGSKRLRDRIQARRRIHDSRGPKDRAR